MKKAKKEILFHYGLITHFLPITKRDNLRDLRRLIDEKISSYMKPKGDWIFSVDGVQVGKKQEEEKRLWRDIIKRKKRVELVEEKKKILYSRKKRKSPAPKKEEEVKEDLDSDCEPGEDPGQGSSGSGRKKTKRTNPAVTPDRAPSSRGAASPETQSSNQNALRGTEDSVHPYGTPSNRGAVTPEHTNSGSHELPERQPSSRNVVQQRIEEASNDQPDTVAAPSAAPSSMKPIKEETRKKLAQERKKCFAQYGDRYLLHRHHTMGIRRLGGNMQHTFVWPRADTPAFQEYEYPIPLHLLLGRARGDVTRYDLGYSAYNFTQQPNGPMFAGQKMASVDAVADHFKETGDPFPVFMKRTLTNLHRETEGPVIGWEYVGNYKYVPFDPDDDEAVFYHRNNFSRASKNEIASCMSKSYRCRAEKWRIRLLEEIANEKEPRPDHCLAKRCLDLGFTPDMSGEKLCYLLVELDEYQHTQDLIEFVYYDERIYQYCLGGKTNNTKDGKSISGGAVGEPARAQDWYDFATVNMLFKY